MKTDLQTATCVHCLYHGPMTKKAGQPLRPLWNALLIFLALTGVGLIAILFAWLVMKPGRDPRCPQCGAAQPRPEPPNSSWRNVALGVGIPVAAVVILVITSSVVRLVV